MRPQFENGSAKSLAHRAMAVAVRPASKPAGSLVVGARGWAMGPRTQGEAMARSDVGEKEAEGKGSEVGGRCLFKAEAG
jgi:hypothetical protein